MKLTGHEDMRVRRSITSIRRAFEELVCEKDYSEITVTELSERAMINKKTFYQYYPTLDDLLREVQDELSSEFAERIHGLGLADIRRLTKEFFYFSEEKGTFYEKITCGGSYAPIRQTMIDSVADKSEYLPELESLSPEIRNVIGAYMNSAVLSIYSQWIADGKKIPVDEIIDITTNLLEKGLNQYVQ